jgi:hypothetical protein
MFSPKQNMQDTIVPAFFQRFHLPFIFVSVFIRLAFQFPFHLGSHTKSIAPVVTFKSIERKWNDNWSESEAQMEWER